MTTNFLYLFSIKRMWKLLGTLRSRWAFYFSEVVPSYKPKNLKILKYTPILYFLISIIRRPFTIPSAAWILLSALMTFIIR